MLLLPIVVIVLTDPMVVVFVVGVLNLVVPVAMFAASVITVVLLTLVLLLFHGYCCYDC